MSTITLEKREQGGIFGVALQVFAGPFLVCCTLALALQQRGNLDLGLLCLVGGALCIKLHRRGLFYSVLLLVISSLCKHLFFIDQHFWQLGIEGSAALGFLVSALSAEAVKEEEDAALAKEAGKEQTLRHLEEEIQKTKEVGLQENIALQDRLSSLQKDLDEATSELSSLHVLNKVLRKVQAKEAVAGDEILRKDRELFALSEEISRMKKKLLDSADLAEKERLLQELNTMRVQKEQTHLVNETLARLVSIHSRKAQEAEQKEMELQASLTASQLLQEQVVELSLQKENFEEMVFSLEGDLRDKAHLEGQLEERSQMIAHLEERVKSLGQVQALYLQTRMQFEDKQKVLHETRVELFRTDTELLGRLLDSQLEISNPVPHEEILSRDLSLLERENSALEQENGELTELVSQLVHENAQLSFFPEIAPCKLSTPKKKPAKKKAKKKAKKSGVDQRLLF